MNINNSNTNIENIYKDYFYKYRENDYMIFIGGANCASKVDKSYKKFQNKQNVSLRYYYDKEKARELNEVLGLEVDAYCNRNMWDTHKNVLKYRCALRPSKSDPFIQEIFQMVIELIMLKKRVFLLGYSHGGSVVSRIAERINKEKDPSIFKNVFFITFGSIYIPPHDHVNHVLKNIFHFMMKGDAALYCNHLKGNEIRSDLTWITSQHTLNIPLKHLTQDQRWRAHGDYSSDFTKIIFTDPIYSVVKRLRDLDAEASSPAG